MTRGDVIYQLYVMPSDWTEGHYARSEYDRGLVLVGIPMTAADFSRWTIARPCQWLGNDRGGADGPGPSLSAVGDDGRLRRMHEVARIRHPPTMLMLDCYGMLLEGVDGDGERTVWRLEPRSVLGSET